MILRSGPLISPKPLLATEYPFKKRGVFVNIKNETTRNAMAMIMTTVFFNSPLD